MLDSIRTLTDLPPEDAVCFSQQDLTETRQRRELLEHASRRAQEIVEQAEAQADEMRQQAFQQGYGRGLLQAVDDLVDTLLKSQVLSRQLQEDLAVAARHLLGSALRSEALIDQVLGNWLDEQHSSQDGTLQVVLPQRWQTQEDKLIRQLRERNQARADQERAIRVEFHPQERYLLRLADQVLEFDVESVQEHCSDAVLARIEQLPQAARTLDETAREALMNLLQTLLAEEAGHNNKEPETDDPSTCFTQPAGVDP